MRVSLSLLFVLAAGQVLFGGQSIQTSTTYAYNNSFPSRAHNLPVRVEFYLHDWATNPSVNSDIVNVNAVGLASYIDTSQRMNIFSNHDVGPYGGDGGCNIYLSVLPTKRAYIRYQRDPSAKTEYCEVWGADGRRYFSATWTYTSESGYAFDGAQVGGTTGDNRSIAFLRVCSDLLPLNSRSPVTADTSLTKLLEWKFDNTLLDITSNRWDAAMSSGSPAYVSTPNQNVIAVLKTSTAPSWSNWISLRAGFPGQLNGASSFSQSDSSANVTCFWQALSGPSILTWSSHTDCSPTVNGLVFGSYNFQLAAMDAAGQVSTQTLQIGAVATDSNGVVVNANPNADLIYGPMIAFGRNPWAFQDERALYATTARSAVYDAGGFNPPPWTVAQAGTVAYTWYPWQSSRTTLAADLTASGSSIQVADASTLSLSELPTYILVNGFLGEEVKICSTTATRGAATLGVCYDGRAQHRTNGLGTARVSGTEVKQAKITGTGTSFLSTICPAGAGWNGPVTYNTGTVKMTAGSTAVTGVGTAWTSAQISYAIRVSATHGGAAFTFFAYITAVGSGTALTLARPYPSDADSGTFSYSILNPEFRNIVPHYTRGDGTDGYLELRTSQCGSNTSVYIVNSSDVPSVNNVSFSGKQYSYQDGYGQTGDFGINYYDEGAAHYALYLRSGWGPALDAFHKLEGQDGTGNPGWFWYPDIGQGDASDNGKGRHSSVLGGLAAAVLDGKTSNWSALRTFANYGIGSIPQPCDYDLRENAYALSWLAMAAVFDPDLTLRANWIAQLGNAYTRDNRCKANDNSFKPTTFNTSSTPALTMTNGSTAVTGTAVPDICNNAATVTGVTVTSGSDIVTGTGFLPGNGTWKFAVDGTVGGVPTYLSFDYIYDSPSQIHLSGMYPGATASGLTGLIDKNANGYLGEHMLVFGTGPADTQLAKAWSCVWNNSSRITLDRPWDGPTSSAVYGYRGNVAGIGQQPFVLGIKTLQMSLASKVASSPLNTNYGALANLAANWIKTTGYDPATGGMYYFTLFGACLPVYATSSQPAQFLYVNPGCSYSPSPTNNTVARALNGEAQNAMRILYQTNPTIANRDFGDEFYGKQWGLPSLTQPGFYSDGNITSNIANVNLAAPKWTGFFFGVGMSHQWPAVRLGGVAPAVNRGIAVAFKLASVASAVTFQIVMTAPSGSQTTIACPSSPCVVTADARQGAHLMQLQYLNASSKVVAQSSQAIPVAVQ